MSVLTEVLGWSADRPDWQRDALRRLVETGEIVADDIPMLAEICKSSYGLVEPNPGNPLTTHHLPNQDTALGIVSRHGLIQVLWCKNLHYVSMT